MTQSKRYYLAPKLSGLAYWVFTPNIIFWVVGHWVNPLKSASIAGDGEVGEMATKCAGVEGTKEATVTAWMSAVRCRGRRRFLSLIALELIGFRVCRWGLGGDGEPWRACLRPPPSLLWRCVMGACNYELVVRPRSDLIVGPS
jgi:hypothetical protein